MRLVSLLIFLILGFVARTAYCENTLPDVLRRVAPSVVRVHVGDAWGTGFIYLTPRHVATAYSVVNRNGNVEIVFGNGTAVKAHVVAWSAADNLAILELERPAAAPLSLARSEAFAGLQVILMGYPMRTNPEEEQKLAPRNLPTPRFGRVSFISKALIGIDVDHWRGDPGAPLLLESGEVIGVLSELGSITRGVLDAASSARLTELGRSIGKQGAFEPDPPADTSFFAGVYISPLETDRLHGGGALTGYRYKLIAFTISANALQSGFAPTSSGTFEARTELSAELYGTLDIPYAKGRKLCLGAGGALMKRFNRTRRVLESGELEQHQEEIDRPRPILILQDVEQYLLLGLRIDLAEAAVRLEIGLVFGR